MKHLTTEKWELIQKAARATANLETGCRNEEKTYNRYAIELAAKHSKECQKTPKEYTILYKQTENLGTRNYSDYYTSWRCTQINENYTSSETEKSIIVTRKYDNRRVQIISKEKIIAYIW